VGGPNVRQIMRDGRQAEMAAVLQKNW